MLAPFSRIFSGYFEHFVRSVFDPGNAVARAGTGHSAAGSIALLREMVVSLNSMRNERKIVERRIEMSRRLTRAAELVVRS